jgi:hypothetical protein
MFPSLRAGFYAIVDVVLQFSPENIIQDVPVFPDDVVGACSDKHQMEQAREDYRNVSRTPNSSMPTAAPEYHWINGLPSV